MAHGRKDQTDNLKHQSKINTTVGSHSLTFLLSTYYGPGPAIPWEFEDGWGMALRWSVYGTVVGCDCVGTRFIIEML